MNTAIIYVCFTVGPVIYSLTSDQVEHQNDDVSIQCRVRGHPVPDVMWTHNGNLLSPETENITIQNSLYSHPVFSTLSISSAQAIHSGEYTCVATSPVEEYQPVSESSLLTIISSKLHCLHGIIE